MTTPSLQGGVDDGIRKATRNKKDSIDTTFSLSESSNTLTPSTEEASSSSSSPPLPSTPPRPSRAGTRYPDLGRVPLHRRGTSKTYERLEDLLREHGYKDTRVFTPETERAETTSAERTRTATATDPDDVRRSSMREGVDAVVGFLAGLIPGVAIASRSSSVPRSTEDPANTAQQTTAPPREYSPPVSPLGERQHIQKSKTLSVPNANLTGQRNSSTDNLGDSFPRSLHRPLSSKQPPARRHPEYYQHLPRNRSPAHPPSSFASHREQQLQNQASRTSLNHRITVQPASPGPTTNIAQPQPSRAGAYLRHMASIPHIPPRPSSTPAGQFSRSNVDLRTHRVYPHGDGENSEPPLPRTWLETVARAVLFGGEGAHIGGPTRHAAPRTQSPTPDTRGRTQTLRQTRSSLSQSSRLRKNSRPNLRAGLSDQTNLADNSFLAPPPMLVQFQRGRSGRSEGQVSRTRVVCRSAPGSRASSAVRGLREEKSSRLSAERGRGRKRKKDKDRLPSLARTRAEGDIWSHERLPAQVKSTNDSGDLGDLGGETNSDDDMVESHSVVSSEDDDGELDLARMLVPPKRQNSIKSLRKFLASDAAGSNNAGRISSSNARGFKTGDAGVGRSASNRMLEDVWDADEGQEDYGSKPRTWRHGSGEGDDDPPQEFLREGGSRNGFFGSGRSGKGKGRLQLPGTWGLISGGS